MKKLIYSLCIGTLLLVCNTMAIAETSTKEVCVSQKDSKTNKTKLVCKQVKQHKKLEVTNAADKKAK
jgi:hypothetical protein